MMKIILGSGSRWRRELLRDAGFEFDVMTADIDEKAIRDKNPEKLVLKVANAKADVLLKKIKTPVILITADQIVVCNDHVFEKPESKEDVFYFCNCYSKYSAKTITGIVVINTKTGKKLETVDIAEVTFNPIPKAEIEKQIQKGEIFFCAGGFQIENEDGTINKYIKSLKGTIDSVKGLPIDVVKGMLKKITWGG